MRKSEPKRNNGRAKPPPPPRITPPGYKVEKSLELGKAEARHNVKEQKDRCGLPK